MTTEDAKKAIKEIVETALGERYLEDRVISHYGCTAILQILAKVETPEPDEEGRAVLWLIVEKGYVISTKSKEDKTWVALATDNSLKELAPVAEAKKLGWGG